MKETERLEKFLELQNKNYEFSTISKEIGIAQSTLRQFLNKKGYTSRRGKYVLKENQEEATQTEFTIPSNKKTKAKNITKAGNVTKEKKANTKKEVKVKKTKVKTDKKINVTQEDMDKLCEVYDWYLQVKDIDIYKKKKNNKKDIYIEDTQISDLKTTSIRVEKETWESFERLCSNSQASKQEILTQAIKEFMKKYKHLI